MKQTFVKEPVPHLIIDDFLDNYEEVSTLAEDLYYLTDLGSHDGVYEEKPVTNRSEFYLYERFADENVKKLSLMMSKRLWCEEARQIYDSSPFPYPMLNSTTYDGQLLGYYGEGGFYNLHKDTSFITGLVFLHKEKKFEGGDFILTNKSEPFMVKTFDSVSIEARPNRAVFFPSCYYHAVTGITTLDNSVSSMRISFACFTDFANNRV